MKFSSAFVFATPEYTTFEKFVPAPYFRKEVCFDTLPKKCEVTVSGLGFYRLWINGKEITKGLLAPYISNPDHLVYYDCYDITPLLAEEKNVFGFQLGNGMQNAPGGQVWDFQLAHFRGAPRLAFCIESTDKDGNLTCIEADESVKTAPSPIYFDDMRCGVRYDARNEIDGWNLPDFDASNWAHAKRCETPRGEARLCEADVIAPTGEVLKPLNIRKAVFADFFPSHQVEKVVPAELPDKKEGWLYDFGVNKTGLCELKIKGRKGQRVELQFIEHVNKDGKPTYANVQFYPDGYAQRDVYICKGEGEETFLPPFTYHGFRYCMVLGIDDEQATEDLLTYVVHNSKLGERGSFVCSDETANRLQEICRISDLSNFFYFPTDCPHREKNGWTGDAAISAEHMLMNLDVRASFTEWLRNIRKAQKEDGSLPGIVPTGGWGYEWGNGPAWDAVLTYLPYYTYVYTGDTRILEENAASILRYLEYIARNRTKRGTVDFGLGDWCPVHNRMKAPIEFTSSVTVMSIAEKAAFIFDVLGLSYHKQFAENLYNDVRAATRRHLVDLNTKKVRAFCQTSQAMAIFFNVFEESEKNEAFAALKALIEENDEFIDFGILGARVLFHVLADFGEANLAYKLICRKEWPSYASFLEQGVTSLPEDFHEDPDVINSLNHHFFGDISNWFISKVAGLRYNPDADDLHYLLIKPCFVESLSFAQAHFDSPFGRIDVRWERCDGGAVIIFNVPDGIDAEIELTCGTFEKDGTTHKKVSSNGEVRVALSCNF